MFVSITLKAVGPYAILSILSYLLSIFLPSLFTRNGDGQRAGRAAMARVAGASGGPENGASNSSATE